MIEYGYEQFSKIQVGAGLESRRKAAGQPIPDYPDRYIPKPRVTEQEMNCDGSNPLVPNLGIIGGIGR